MTHVTHTPQINVCQSEVIQAFRGRTLMSTMPALEPASDTPPALGSCLSPWLPSVRCSMLGCGGLPQDGVMGVIEVVMLLARDTTSWTCAQLDVLRMEHCTRVHYTLLRSQHTTHQVIILSGLGSWPAGRRRCSAAPAPQPPHHAGRRRHLHLETRGRIQQQTSAP